MKPTAMQTWAWVLIYGGLLLLSLGVFVYRRDEAVGIGMQAVGAAAAAAGVLLVYLRSRIKE